MNWKDYFDFNRSERRGIITFIVLLMIIILIPHIHYRFFYSGTVVDPAEYEEEILAFEEQLKRHREEPSSGYIAEESSDITESSEADDAVSLTPFEFNPNDLPESSWLEMGMPGRITSIIKNYEAAGGSFTVKEDLKRIYGITDEMYLTLKPYINLPSRDEYQSRIESTYDPPVIQAGDPLLVDINSADTVELMEIRGIGPVFSDRIVRYRSLIGGFVSVNQVLDVYGIDKERFESIREYMTIKDTNTRKININTAAASHISRHPYIDKNIAVNIENLRKQHGKFKTVEDIKRSHLIDDDTYTMIAPYLSVDDH